LEIKNYAVEVPSNGIEFTLNFVSIVKIVSLVQKYKMGHTDNMVP